MSLGPKILHVIPSVAPCRGGPSEVLFPMVGALQKRGLRIDIATTNDNGPGELNVPVDSFIDWKGTRVHFFPRASICNRAVREFAYSGAFATWIGRHVLDYDLIQVHGLFSFVCSAAMASARRRCVPYVIRPLGTLGRWSLRQKAWKKQLYFSLWERANLANTAAFHFTSGEERDEASALVPRQKGHIIPHGILSPHRIPNAGAEIRDYLRLPSTEKIVLFLGRLHPKKGLDFLLSGISALRILPVTLVLAGDGEPSFVRKLDAEILRRGLSTKVKRLGYVSGPLKERLLQGADLFVLLSRHENFGYAVLEALASGLPVLISDQVPFAEEVRRFKLGRAVRLEMTEVVRALEDMLRLGSAAGRDDLRSFVEQRYSWDRNAGTLAELYSSILRAGRKNVLGGPDGVRFNHGPKDEHDHDLCARPGRVAGQPHGL